MKTHNLNLLERQLTAISLIDFIHFHQKPAKF